MSADALLLWMSARQKGSWQQFRAAVEELHLDAGDVQDLDSEDATDSTSLPLYQALRLNLQRVGHAEFFAGAGDAEWRVCPPTLALAQGLCNCLGTLVGARSTALLHRVTVPFPGISLRTNSSPACPSHMSFLGNSRDALASFAKETGLYFQGDAPASLLACLPAVDDCFLRASRDMPFGAGWKVDEFSAEDLRWHPATLSDAASARGGFFRLSLRYQRYFFYCVRGSNFPVPNQVGKYLVLKRRRRRVLRYDPALLRLSVPAACRPPFLIERALILCSGSLPNYQSGSGSGILEYDGIPQDVARTVLALLRQEFQ